MAATSLRRDADVERLRALAAASRGRITLVEPAGRNRFVLDLGVSTAGSRAYPVVRQSHARVMIDLPARYPFQPPVATVTTPIFHPNVHPSGLVCIGTKWLPSEGMDLFVRRLVQLLVFDPLLVNVHSVANPQALAWYLEMLRRYPQAFPSDSAELELPAVRPSRMQWSETTDDRVIRCCPRCATRLRLPAGRRGTVRCPTCATTFETET